MGDFGWLVAGLGPVLAQGAAAPKGGGGIFGDYSIVVPAMLVIAVFYFMILRPDMQKQKDAQKRLSELKKNDAIVTVGGICGVIVNISPDSKYLTIRIDDGNNTKMRILRSAVAGLESAEDSKDKKDAS